MSRTDNDLILVVDDEATIREILTRWLSGHGYRVQQAANAAEALRLIAAEEPALILSDILMPGASGIELLQQVKRQYPEVAVVMATAVDDLETAVQAVKQGAYGYVIKPFLPDEILVNVFNALRRRTLEIESRRHRQILEQTVAERTADLRRAMDDLARLHDDLRRAHQDIVVRLATAANYRDLETGAHIRRIGEYSGALARWAQQPEEYADLLALAAPMHDVGKIGVPDAILRKPGPLTPEEFGVMQTHCQMGAAMLAESDVPLLQLSATIALTHHEKWDGSGYPRGLRGETIPLCGRIVGLVDVFDALTTARVYKPAFSLEKSLAIMREGRGLHFDPDLLDLFLDHLPEVQEIMRRWPEG